MGKRSGDRLCHGVQGHLHHTESKLGLNLNWTGSINLLDSGREAEYDKAVRFGGVRYPLTFCGQPVEESEMQTYWMETVISQNRVLTIRGVPFRAGEKVEVIILSRPPVREGAERYPLRGQPVRYLAPFDGVAENGWNALR